MGVEDVDWGGALGGWRRGCGVGALERGERLQFLVLPSADGGVREEGAVGWWFHCGCMIMIQN